MASLWFKTNPTKAISLLITQKRNNYFNENQQNIYNDKA
jgi:hypothetical protein